MFFLTFSVFHSSFVSAQKKDVAMPEVFALNCSACHHLKQSVVGPSLVEVAEIYEKDESAFIKWCIKPGKKRDHMAQMPSMAHISEADLKLIYKYVRTITRGEEKEKEVKSDSYATSPTMTARPRVIRTFVPNAGPASLYIALPTEEKHNIIWDTDLCRLRYITTGEPNAWDYYKENGNALAKVGERCYTEERFIFTGDSKPEFKGYKIKGGLPTFIYMLGNVRVTEEIRVEGGSLQRVITGFPKLPEHIGLNDTAEAIQVSSVLEEQTLTITYTPQ